jgi:hypothetical protein
MLKIRLIEFPDSQYYPEVSIKNQIVLHHTVSDPFSAIGDVNSFLGNPQRIATCEILSYDGTVNKLFQTNMSGAHLGVKEESLKKMGFEDYKTRNHTLDIHSIAIEIDSWGGLVLGNGKQIQFGLKADKTPNMVKTENGKFYNAYGKPVSDKLEIVEVDWRGYKYFQKYGDAQIEALGELLPIMCKANNIQSYGLKDGNFDVRKDALQGTSGIFSHSNYRADKSDLYPDPRIVQILNRM